MWTYMMVCILLLILLPSISHHFELPKCYVHAIVINLFVGAWKSLIDKQLMCPYARLTTLCVSTYRL